MHSQSEGATVEVTHGHHLDDQAAVPPGHGAVGEPIFSMLHPLDGLPQCPFGLMAELVEPSLEVVATSSEHLMLVQQDLGELRRMGQP